MGTTKQYLWVGKETPIKRFPSFDRYHERVMVSVPLDYWGNTSNSSYTYCQTIAKKFAFVYEKEGDNIIYKVWSYKRIYADG